MVSLTTQPIEARPRERLLHTNLEAFSLEEIICLLLGTGAKNAAVHILAERVALVLQQPNVTLQDLTALEGIGLARASLIMAALQLSATLQQERNMVKALSTPEKLYEASQDIVHKPQENLLVYYLSSRLTILRRKLVSVGTATASLIHPREVFRSAIAHNASAIALVHNHPSGSTDPSQADLTVTYEIAQAGRVVGIELVDHLILSPKGFTSLKMASPELFC